MIASADRPAKGGIGQVVANGIVADGRTVLLEAEPRDIGGCGAGDSHLFQGPILTGSDRHGGRGVSPMCRRWSNSRIGYEGFWKPRPCSRILRA